MNIMIVDDEIATLEILSASIDWSLLGIHQVFTVRNAMEAKALLAKDSIAITVCDIEMPRESGLELISWIKDLYPEIVNIILTGHQDFNYDQRCRLARRLCLPVKTDPVRRTGGNRKGRD